MDVKTIQWSICFSTFNKYLNQTESEMETTFGAELVKTIMNQFIANAKIEKNKGSIISSRVRDRKDHTFNEHDQGLYNFTQSHYYDVSSFKSEFRLKEHLQISRLRFNTKLNAWEGMYFDNNGRSQGEFQQMTDEWIDENFDKEDLKLLK